ncbi:hypothetical protein C2S51_020823 [Perilla frutescens var. frutescens]|nr:hypothetical protein C2S51_020823 [Perilla frutescens var. frutescens]
MSARGGGRASRGSSRASTTSRSSSAGLSGGVGGLDLEGSSVGHVVDPTSRRAIRVEDDVMMPAYEVSSAITAACKKYIHPIGYS